MTGDHYFVGVTLQRYTSVSYYGKTSLIFIDNGVKVNADNSISRFSQKTYRECFLDKERIWCYIRLGHSHNAKRNIDFLNKRKVEAITLGEWIPKSVDAAPMDFGIWSILKRRPQFTTWQDLKRPSKTNGINALTNDRKLAGALQADLLLSWVTSHASVALKYT